MNFITFKKYFLYSLATAIFFLIGSFSNTISQIPVPDSIAIANRITFDTVCFKYNFHKGDKLTYLAKSSDSISINFGPALLKNRQEVIEIRCDSVSSNGTFFLTQKLIAYISIESSESEKNVERTSSPWIERKISFVIDSAGNRLAYFQDDSAKAAMCPGGAYSPNLIFPFKTTCKAINESWMVSTTDELFENGFPVPMLKQSTLFRARRPIDTLGFNCKRMEFIKTAQGNYELPIENKKITVNSVINGYGTLDISDSLMVPIHLYATQEEKLTLIFGTDNQQKGWHYIRTNFILKEYVRGNEVKFRYKPGIMQKHKPKKSHSLKPKRK